MMRVFHTCYRYCFVWSIMFQNKQLSVTHFVGKEVISVRVLT
jgi:hypothetical protein